VKICGLAEFFQENYFATSRPIHVKCSVKFTSARPWVNSMDIIVTDFRNPLAIKETNAIYA
jgi:hypothetical protein